jgi:hypothetical protein
VFRAEGLDDCLLAVGAEALNNDLFYVHFLAIFLFTIKQLPFDRKQNIIIFITILYTALFEFCLPLYVINLIKMNTFSLAIQ